jgi:transposase
MKINNINVFESIENAKKQMTLDKSLSPIIKATIDLLILVITLLVNRINLNSSNSSIPPSKNPIGKNPKKEKRKRKGKKRKRGGQKGHDGKTLEKVEDPDEVETLEVDMRSIPPGNYQEVGHEIRQTIDIKISRYVKEYRAQILENENGEQYVAEFPEDVKRAVQYGNEVKSHSVYMSQFQLVPIDRIKDHFTDQMGIPISTGTIVNFNKAAYDLLEEFDNISRTRLIEAIKNNADETGINVGGKRIWLHCISNELWTMYFPHEKRGSEAMNDMGILPYFKGCRLLLSLYHIR